MAESSGGKFNRILKIAYREAKETDNWLQVIKTSREFAQPAIINLAIEIEADNLEVIKVLHGLKKSIQNLL